MGLFFFFSSRRRHTRSLRDWSSDVCSSDLLVDSQGRALYLFQKDMGTKSACTGACAVAWPPLRASAHPLAGTGVTVSKVATTARSDGAPQVTYNGHPLYLYAADQRPGDTNGQGITAFGGGWFVLAAAGNLV